MKKKFLLLALLGAGVLTLSSCGTETFDPYQPSDDGEVKTPWTDYSTPVEEIHIAPECENIVLENKGVSKEVVFSVKPRSAVKRSVTWESSDSNIASVSEENETGKILVTGVNGGSCKLTATSGNVIEEVDVTVEVPITDFALGKTSVDLDWGESIEIPVTYTPSDTTFKDLQWTTSDESITVSDNVITVGSKNIENGTIKVVSPKLDKEVTINVKVSDKWNYVSKIALSAESSEVEVDRELQLDCLVTPIYTDREASTLAKHSIVYESLTKELLSVSEDGVVTGIKDSGSGKGKIKASLFDERANVTKEAEIELEVYEVKAGALEIKDHSKGTIYLDNQEGTSATQIVAEYKDLDDTRQTRPSKMGYSFVSDHPEIASVDEEGNITAHAKGDAKITVTDNVYDSLTDYVNVHVTVIADSIELIAPKNAAVGVPFELKAITYPDLGKLSDSTIDFTFEPSDAGELVNNGDGTATFTGNKDVSVKFVASSGSLKSEPEFTEVDYVFEESTFYVVGSKNYNDGTSKEGESWNKAGRAFALSDSTPPEGYDHQVFGRITFEEGDEFKLRKGDVWIDNVKVINDVPNYYVELDQGSLAQGKISLVQTGGEGYGNLRVEIAGTYDIYYKEKLDEFGSKTYSIYIGDAPVFRFENAPKMVDQHQQVTAKIADPVGGVTVTSSNANVDLDYSSGTGEIHITGVNVGTSSVISATDSERTVSYTIKVLGAYAIAGSFNDYNSNDPEWAMTKVSADHYVVEGKSFHQGDKLQAVYRAENSWFGNESEYDGCHYTLETNEYGSKLLVVDEAGEYNIHVYLKDDGGNPNANPIVLRHPGEEPAPIVVYDYDWYLNLNGSCDSKDISTSLNFEVDSMDSNIYWIRNVSLNVDDTLKAYDPADDQWLGIKTTKTGAKYWKHNSNEDLVVTVAGTYDVKLYVDHGEHNHLELFTEAENWGEGAALVGSKNFSGSGPAGASWEDATKAYKFTVTGGGDLPEGCEVQYYADIALEAGDLFRFRVNGEYYNDIVELKGGAYGCGQIMSVKDSDNYKVLKSGTYKFYVKKFATSWSVYIGAIDAENVKTYFVTNNHGWDNLRVYLFKDGVNEPKWPGMQLVSVDTDPYGHGRFAFTVDITLYDQFVINSESKMGNFKTQDVSISWFADNSANAIWIKDEKATSDGSFYIDFWNWSPAPSI